MKFHNEQACCFAFPITKRTLPWPHLMIVCFVSTSIQVELKFRHSVKSIQLLQNFLIKFRVMTYRSHTAAPSRVFDHLYDPIFTTSDPKNVYKENCIALTRSAPIHVYPVYRSMFSELNQEERNCYAYQKNTLPHFPLINTISIPQHQPSVTGTDRAKFFSNPMGNIRTINVGLMADESLESIEEAQVVRFRSTTVQTTYRLDNRRLIKTSYTYFYAFQRIVSTNKALVT